MANDNRDLREVPYFPGGGGGGGEGYPYTPTIPPDGAPPGWYSPFYPPPTAPDISLPGNVAPDVPPPSSGSTPVGGTFADPGGGLGPLYSPGSGNLSSSELDRLLGERSPGSGVGILATISGIFKGTYRRPSLRTVASRGIRELVRAGLERLTTPRPPIGPIITRPGLPVMYEPPARRFIPLPGILGALVYSDYVLRPTTLGRGDLTPYEVKYYGLNPIDPRRYGQPIGAGPSPFPLGQPVNVALNRVLGQLGGPTPELPRELTPREVLRGVIRDIAEGTTPGQIYQGLGLGGPRPEEYGPPAKSPTPVPATEVGKVPGVPQVPQTTIPQGPGQARARRRARRNQIIRFGLGSVAIGSLLELARDSSSGPQPSGAATPSPSIGESQTVTPVPAPLTALNSGFVGFGAGDVGYCQPRPRGPRRKCLQRAPVKWSGGPRKGKSAGTRCIRFGSRK